MDGVEILVHNLSHSDLVLSLNATEQSKLTKSENSVIARPKFSHFHGISEQILNQVSTYESDISITRRNLFSRKTGQAVSSDQVAVGFNFSNHPIKVHDLSALRFRHDDKNVLLRRDNGAAGSDHQGAVDTIQTDYVLENAYFPLIAALVPKWLGTIDEERQLLFNKVIVLVSGRGTPMIQTSGNENDNSTKSTADLIRLLIQKAYPGIQVKLVHSESNLFRYDENIMFVKNELLPMINTYRDQLVVAKGAEWKEHMRVSLSFADGSSARISAINASLRYYRPAYMHFWQLKSFWRELMICEDDIECHSYEEISTEPALKIENTRQDPQVSAVLAEMQKFREDFAAVLLNDIKNDLGSFWLRKTKKPVLAVLLVQKPNGPYKLYRGTNMEVSMPTGSLCAERNVIGTALSDDITLRREDIKIVAVYAASMATPASLNRTAACCGGFSKQNSVNLGGVSAAAELYEPTAPNGAYRGSSGDTVGTMGTVGTADGLVYANGNGVGLPYATVSMVHSPQRSASLGSDPAAAVGGSTPIRTLGGGALEQIQTDFTCQPCAPSQTASPTHTPGRVGRSESDPGPPSQANTPVIGTPSPQHSGYFATTGGVGASQGGAKSPQAALGKRKIMDIGGRKFSTTSFADMIESGPASAQASVQASASKKSVRVKTEESSDATVGSVLPSAPPASGLSRTAVLTRSSANGSAKASLPDTGGSAGANGSDKISTASNGASATSATTTAPSHSSSRRRTKTVAFSASSTNLVPHSSPSPTAFLNGNGPATIDSERLSLPGLSRQTSDGFAFHGMIPLSPNASAMDLSAMSNGEDFPYNLTGSAIWPHHNHAIRTETITVDKDDLNPLKPCGACNEWLKKIAEVNPQLRVITFTDASCCGVHIEPVDD